MLVAFATSKRCGTDGLLILLEDDEPEPLPVHLVMPDGRLGIAKVRAFVDFAASRLKAQLRSMERRRLAAAGR